jgi:peptidoglycan/LPS O-acetylase OafA/YrhL
MAGKTKELRALTGLRGIAALSVALAHYDIGDVAGVLKLLYWKNAAVDLFFCLSGFTLCLAYNAGRDKALPFRTYLGARLARIYPLYLISMAAMGLWIMVEYRQRLGMRDFIQQILMINAWPVFGTGIHWDFPAWSVSVEFFCYLFVFPAAFYASRRVLRLDWRIRATLAIVPMAVSTLLFLGYWNGGWLIVGLSHWPGTAFPPFPYYVPVIRGILGMLAGWLAYLSYLSRDRFCRWIGRRADLLVLALLGFLVGDASNLLSNQWMLPLFPALILGLVAETSLSSRLIASKPVHYLGAISYSIYLLHIPWRLGFGLVTGIAAKDMPHRPAVFLALLGGLILVAGLSHRFVEMPLRGLIRRAFAATPRSGRPVEVQPTTGLPSSASNP